jgi:hypothetical protein
MMNYSCDYIPPLLDCNLVTGETMSTEKELPAMAKRGRGRPKTDNDNVTVKIDRSLVMKAKLIGSHRGISAAELLNEILQAPVDRAYAQMLRELEGSEKK